MFTPGFKIRLMCSFLILLYLFCGFFLDLFMLFPLLQFPTLVTGRREEHMGCFPTGILWLPLWSTGSTISQINFHQHLIRIGWIQKCIFFCNDFNQHSWCNSRHVLYVSSSSKYIVCGNWDDVPLSTWVSRVSQIFDQNLLLIGKLKVLKAVQISHFYATCP